jgi:hypothetical protein
VRPSSAAAARTTVAGGAKDGQPSKTLAQEHAGVNEPPKPTGLAAKIDQAELKKIEKKITSEHTAISAIMALVYDIRVSKMAAFDAKRS